MSKPNLSHKFGKGLPPKEFIASMTKNQSEFQANYDSFVWASEEDREFFESLNYRDDLRVLILAADWCGDVVRNIPVVFQALEISGIPTEVLIMENHPDVMDEFLTMGGRSVPIVIVADTGGHVLGQWGPRPQHVQEVMVEFKRLNPDREAADYQDNMAEARKEILKRYGEGTESHAVVIRELRELISGF
ncbi:thioredoxin family protein [Paenibacillus polysaccharolyticus]|uniref:thioredoxin family protein n=1 Tax=Paenibacillus polysaccharolyticus TaxID=582692 RepID=UPI00203F3452|nr:thioredoxin family protein [Paenibacillus polysaccharolyticus]MCM3136414.1 thioredoxin family protein [Paenibacillus polysaccharolyticus]